jgi:alpha,alpha-trehalose phosphorylase
MRDHGETLTFAPRLPAALTRLSFGMHYRGRCFRVEISSSSVRYELMTGEPLEIVHEGKPLVLERGVPRVLLRSGSER